jgi:hypothetical protein
MAEFYLPGINRKINANSISYFCQDKQVRVRLAPMRASQAKGYCLSRLFIEFEIQKVLKKNPIAIINAEDCRRALLKVDEILTEAGVKVVIDSLKISSIHLKRDIITNHPLSEYDPLFSLYLKMNRAKTMVHKGSDNFNRTLLNKSYTLVIYDKQKQLEEKKGLRAMNLDGKSLIRWEYRLKGCDAVKRRFVKYKIPQDINLFISEREYQKLTRLFADFLSEVFFDHIPPEAKYQVNNPISNIAHLHGSGCSRSVSFRLLYQKELEQRGILSEVLNRTSNGRPNLKKDLTDYLKDLKNFRLISPDQWELAMELKRKLFGDTSDDLTGLELEEIQKPSHPPKGRRKK